MTASHFIMSHFQPQSPSGVTSHPHRPRRSQASVRALVALVGCLALSVAPTAVAEPGASESAKGVIHGAIELALSILRDETLKKDSKARLGRLRQTVDHVFDWETMAQSSIGHHWRKLDDGQRKEFVGVFKELLAKQYMDDIDRFQGSEKLQVVGAESRGSQVIVQTVLITVSRERVPIDYTLHKPGKSWLVEDVAIEHVSMVNHYRKSFGRFLVNGEFGDLMRRLKRKLGVP